MEYPDGPSRKYSPLKAPFRTDEASRQVLRAADHAREGANSKLYATLEGVIETREPAIAGLVLEKAPNTQLGFGHLGVAPAAIVVKRVLDVEIIRQREDGSTERIAILPDR